ncbi:hypothetical protein KKE78_01450 [Patescibacteria group bacterium]|nr:hypothetical protein [Patescibacteria group bacterium]
MMQQSEQPATDAEKATRLSDLARILAYLTSHLMTDPEQRHLKQRAENNIAPYAKQEIEITDETRKDLHWIFDTFELDLKLLLPETKKISTP